MYVSMKQYVQYTEKCYIYNRIKYNQIIQIIVKRNMFGRTLFTELLLFEVSH